MGRPLFDAMGGRGVRGVTGFQQLLERHLGDRCPSMRASVDGVPEILNRSSALLRQKVYVPKTFSRLLLAGFNLQKLRREVPAFPNGGRCANCL